MLISRSLKLIDNPANVSTPATRRSVSTIDVSRACLASVKSANPRNESKMQMRLGLAALWLMLLAEILLFAAGIFSLAQLDKMRETESQQLLRSAPGDIPAQSNVTFEEALWAFGARR